MVAWQQHVNERTFSNFDVAAKIRAPFLCPWLFFSKWTIVSILKQASDNTCTVSD